MPLICKIAVNGISFILNYIEYFAGSAIYVSLAMLSCDI